MELRGFEPMAIAAAARSQVGSPRGVFARLLRPPSAEDLPLAGPLLDIEEEERALVVTSAQDPSQIDKHLKLLRNADSDLCQRFDILTSIPGIGEVTANVLVVETPELGRLEHAQVASLEVWRLSRGTAARPMESDPSAAGAHEPDRLSTCPPSTPSD